MNWNPFKKNNEPDFDPLADLTLSKVKPGYVLDYDLKTWKVESHNKYDYDGSPVDEWVLISSDETRYLERSEDDEIIWTLSQKIRLSDLEGNVRDHLQNNDDPPENVTHNGATFQAESSSAGKFYKDGDGTGQDVILWDYVDDSESKILSIEQWGENEYEASVGDLVEEFQFSNILPAP